MDAGRGTDASGLPSNPALASRSYAAGRSARCRRANGRRRRGRASRSPPAGGQPRALPRTSAHRRGGANPSCPAGGGARPGSWPRRRRRARRRCACASSTRTDAGRRDPSGSRPVARAEGLDRVPDSFSLGLEGDPSGAVAEARRRFCPTVLADASVAHAGRGRHDAALAGAVGNDRNRPADRNALRERRRSQGAGSVPRAAPETPRFEVRNGMSAACVAVRVVDVHAVVHDDRGAARPAIPARAVPGNVRFSRSQRAPADAAESGPDARPNDMVEAEERDERGSPGVAEPRSARIPPPAVAHVAIPPSPVVGSPAPGFVADPTPAVIVQPDPTAMPVRDPSNGDSREPAVADARYMPPRPMVVKRFRPVNIAAEVAVRPGAAQTLVPIDRPPVEVVLGPSAAGRDLRPIQALAHDHCPAALENLRAGLEGDFRFALPDRDDRFVRADLDPIATGLAGPHRH